ncbi:hypothetical protein C1H46_013995 [Malus baccata]|uniref:Uncharacterized protein n=1 Tax=Malus baccata TaxID=106549 RepID=A0A540MNQ5_MALBA|nr:hypothetical protein C1H46_013995 [Malus baccata]
MQLKPFNSFSIAFRMSGAFSILFLCSFLENGLLRLPISSGSGMPKWVAPFQREALAAAVLQQIRCKLECEETKLEHVSVLGERVDLDY